MGFKFDAYKALNTLIKEYNLAPSSVGREISGDPGFVKRLKYPKKEISTKTLDRVWRFILKTRGQKELDLKIRK
jgi:uncharacterized protein (UPF0297 family)